VTAKLPRPARRNPEFWLKMLILSQLWPPSACSDEQEGGERARRPFRVRCRVLCPPTQGAFEDTEVTSSHDTEVTSSPPHISSILDLYIPRALSKERWSARGKRKGRAGLETDR
jgi:hypothetical protein